jgi:hypothetical protein
MLAETSKVRRAGTLDISSAAPYRLAKTRTGSGRPHILEESADFELEAIAVAGQHLCGG